ncbi:MAG: hypothetical protein AAF206_00325 [Bacteroidota bacterium]
MKKLQSYLLAICMSALLIGPTACEPVQQLEPAGVEEPSAPAFSLATLKVRDGVIQFKDARELWDAIAMVPTVSEEAYQSWGEANHFQSMFDQYTAYFKLTEAAYENGYKSSFDELRQIYAESVVIEDDGMFEINCPFPSIGKFTTEDGLVKVGDALYKFFKQGYVVIEDGNPAKIEAAMRLDEDDPELGVKVYKATVRNLQSRTACGSLDYSLNGSLSIPFQNEWCWRIPATKNHCTYKLGVEVITIQAGFNFQEKLYVKGYRRTKFFGAWTGYANYKTVTNTFASISDNGSSIGFSNSLFGAGGSDALLEIELFNSSASLPTAIVYPAFLSTPGYDQTCLQFDVTFHHPEGSEFIRIE